MHFMDAKSLFFSHCWKEATRSSLKVHRFRTHTKQELESFERKRSERHDNRRSSIVV
jgi:hypothetical protein